jgi:hypothetical protein
VLAVGSLQAFRVQTVQIERGPGIQLVAGLAQGLVHCAHQGCVLSLGVLLAAWHLLVSKRPTA